MTIIIIIIIIYAVRVMPLPIPVMIFKRSLFSFQICADDCQVTFEL